MNYPASPTLDMIATIINQTSEKKENTSNFFKQNQFVLDFFYTVDQYLNSFSSDPSNPMTQRINDQMRRFQNGDLLKQAQIKLCPNKLLTQHGLPLLKNVDDVQQMDLYISKSESSELPLKDLKSHVLFYLQDFIKTPNPKQKLQLQSAIETYNSTLSFRSLLADSVVQQVDNYKQKIQNQLTQFSKLKIEELEQLSSCQHSKLQLDKQTQFMKQLLQKQKNCILFMNFQEFELSSIYELQSQIQNNEYFQILQYEFNLLQEQFIQKQTELNVYDQLCCQKFTQQDITDFQKLVMSTSRLNLRALIQQLRSSTQTQEKMKIIEKKAAEEMIVLEEIQVGNFLSTLGDQDQCRILNHKYGWLLKSLFELYKALSQK